MKNYGDICLINGGNVEAVDCVIGGSPCFPGGTMIMTDVGQKPIEDVLVGDFVYTHRQRYRRVLSTGTRKASLVKLTDGMHDIICTAGHPFYSKYLDGNDTLWTPAMDMFGMRWAYVDGSRHNEFVWIEVKSVKDIHTTCTVYNLEVDEDNSYVAENIVVHNCQNLSVAGNRKGLEGSESRLFLEQMRVIKEMRQATDFMKPRYMVLENVTGLLNCNKGKDFQCVLNECVHTALLGKINLNKGMKDGEKNIAEEDSDGRETEIPDVPMPKDGKWPKSGILYDDMGRWSIAWRVHDAQYWGVAQRRRRIALVCDFGGMSAPEVLFEQQSVQRDFDTCNSQGEGAAETSTGSPEESDRIWDARGNGNGRLSATLTGDHDNRITDYTNVVVSSEPYTLDSSAVSHGIASIKGTGCGVRHDGISPTLTTGQVPSICNVEPYLLESNQNHATVTNNGVCSTLPAPMGLGGGYVPMVTEETYSINGDAHESGVSVMREMSHALKTTTKESVFVKQSSDDVATQQSYPCICIGNGQAHVTEHYTEEVSQTLNCMHDPMTILEPCAYQLVGVNSNSMKSSNPNSGCSETEQYGTITTNGCVPNNQGGTAIMEPVSNSGCCVSYGETESSTERHPVVVDRAAFNQGKNAQFDIKIEETETIPSMVARGPHAVAQPVQYRVRRLTPLECTRLQGYPSGWIDIGDWVDTKGKKHKEADAPKYKALGNSIALPFWKWLCNNIVNHLKKDGDTTTMASLFDGIGGFPLCWIEATLSKESVLWVSEIEEFPLAVTRYHFS